MKIGEVKLKTVNTDKLIEFLGVNLKDNEKLTIDMFAVWEDKFCVTPDSTFWEVTNKHYNNKINKVIDIDCRIKKYDTDGSYSLRMDKPDFVKTITLQDYLSIANEVMLVDYIRFNYNPRIISNQKLFMEYVNEQISLLAEA